MIWWDKSWNPILGCTKCSPACDNCYAERTHTQRHRAKLAGVDMPLCYAKPFGEVSWFADRLEQPLHWRKPQRIFVGNMTDIFHPDVKQNWLNLIFHVMAHSPQHTFMLCTKRPDRMEQYINGVINSGMTWREGLTGRPLPNVWIGTTIWDQPSADERIPILLRTPAAKHYVSYEPALGPVDGRKYMRPRQQFFNAIADVCANILGEPVPSVDAGEPGLDWVICGGENGPGARPMHPDWPRSLRDQCQAAGVPFFFKQWGEWAENGRPSDTWDDELMMYRVGSRRAGRVLDGRTWEEVPTC